MSSRFSKVYELPEYLYSPESPVAILAGALLHDAKTSSAVAQLKLQNVSRHTIQSVSISLSAFDSCGEEIEGVKGYQYSGAEPGQFFGEGKAILMSVNDSYSFVISGMEVTFFDGSRWIMNPDDNLESQFTNEPLRNAIPQDDLIAEYRNTVSRNANTVPKQSKIAWLCACGTVNVNGECVKCHAEKQKVFEACDIDFLRAQIETREEQKRKEREEKIAAAREKTDAIVNQGKQIAQEKTDALMNQGKKIAGNKKIRKGIIIGVVAVVAISIAAVGGSYLMDEFEQRSTYDEAVECLETGDYTQAAMLFESLSDYEDAGLLVMQAKYEQASQLFEQENYKEAASLFEEISGYEDSDLKVRMALESYAEQLYDEGRYALARHEYQQIGKYTAGLAKAEIALANQWLDNNKYDEAESLFLEVIEECSSQSGLIDEIQQCKYGLANIYIETERYKEAEDLLIELGYYKDATDLLSEIQGTSEATESENGGRYDNIIISGGGSFINDR